MSQELDTIELKTPRDLRIELEAAAERLNLSLPAYIVYLHERHRAGASPDLDRMVREVYGRYGKVMRRLAQ